MSSEKHAGVRACIALARIKRLGRERVADKCHDDISADIEIPGLVFLSQLGAHGLFVERTVRRWMRRIARRSSLEGAIWAGRMF